MPSPAGVTAIAVGADGYLYVTHTGWPKTLPNGQTSYGIARYLLAAGNNASGWDNMGGGVDSTLTSDQVGGYSVWATRKVTVSGSETNTYDRVLLGAQSDPVVHEIARLRVPPLAAAATLPRPVTNPAELAVSEELANALGVHDVEVSLVAAGTLITLKGDQFFAPGSARPDPKLQPVIQRVAEALDQVPGAVLVTGHTDDQPIRTARFPSNWELSTERARSVVGLMAAGMKDPVRLRAEGLADSEPLAPNDSAANRAKNRRVAIILRSGS